MIDDADAFDGSVGEDELLAECRGLVGSCDKLSCRAARLCDGCSSRLRPELPSFKPSAIDDASQFCRDAPLLSFIMGYKLLRDLCTNRTIRYSDKGDQGVVVLNMEYVPELLVLAETLSYTETARRDFGCEPSR